MINIWDDVNETLINLTHQYKEEESFTREFLGAIPYWSIFTSLYINNFSAFFPHSVLDVEVKGHKKNTCYYEGDKG